MTTIEKTLIAVGSGLLIIVISFYTYTLWQLKNQQKEIETTLVNQKKITEDILRSSSSFATTKDLEAYSKDNKIDLQSIRKDLSKLDAKVVSINTSSIESSGYFISHVGSTSVTKDPEPNNQLSCVDKKCTDTYGYLNTTQHLLLNEKFGELNVPFGQASFSAGQKQPWSLSVDDRQYVIHTVVGEDESGRQYYYNQATIKVGDKEYKIPVKQASTLQQYPSDHFSFWNPSLYLGVSASAFSRKDVGTSLGFGFISYGKTKVAPTFTFLQLGVGYGLSSTKTYAYVTPVSYRIGNVLPLLKNTYMGLSIGLSLDNKYMLQGGLSTAL